MHNTRERQPPNADLLRREDNWVQGGSVDEVMKNYQERLPEKVRKNAVHAIELMMTASADFKGNWREYLKECGKWAEQVFGKENVLSVAHHLDEKTPHAQILVMPMKDGKLNAKHFIGGSRDRMAELQDDFYKRVGLPAGLLRGQSRAETKARHTPHTLAAETAKLEEEKEKVLDVLKVPTVEALQAISVFRELKTKTPADLKNLANKIQDKNCSTWGEYRDKMQRELEEKKRQTKQQQQNKSRSGFSR